ncbi:MAG: hypothetical protein R2715_20235 [Ilumatobacteraceae bacterium]
MSRTEVPGDPHDDRELAGRDAAALADGHFDLGGCPTEPVEAMDPGRGRSGHGAEISVPQQQRGRHRVALERGRTAPHEDQPRRRFLEQPATDQTGDPSGGDSVFGSHATSDDAMVFGCDIGHGAQLA